MSKVAQQLNELNQQLNGLKDMLTENNEKITALDLRITNNHKELMHRIEQVEEKSNIAYQTALNNEKELFDLKNNYDQIKNEIDNKLENIKSEIREEVNIKKIEAQLRATHIELEDLRNRSMRSTLIFKNIKEENHENWEDSSRILCNYIKNKLNLPYTYEELDLQISRAHRGAEIDRGNNQRNLNNQDGSRPIFAQFTNWRVAEEIRNRIIFLNSKKETRVICNQMFSKELTTKRNNALKFRREKLNSSPDLQIKLEYPACLKSRKRGSNGKWDILKEF